MPASAHIHNSLHPVPNRYAPPLDIFQHIHEAGGGGGSRQYPAPIGRFDVSTQADISHLATNYESDDESMGRRRLKPGESRAPTTTYSKQEFREQYCITSKQLDLFELERSKKDRFLGCLSQYQIESPCSRANNRSSLLSVCVRRRVPSDENLNIDYAPIQRYPRFSPPAPPPEELYQYDEDLECSYFRRRPRSVCSQPDPKYYTWMPEDEDSTRMEWPRPIMGEDGRSWPHSYSSEHLPMVAHTLPHAAMRQFQCPAHPGLPPPPPPPAPPAAPPQHQPTPILTAPHRAKHVSFARSHTLTTFDDAAVTAAVVSSGGGSATLPPQPTTIPSGIMGGSIRGRGWTLDSTERLLDGRKKPEKLPMFDQLPYPPLTVQPYSTHVPMAMYQPQVPAPVHCSTPMIHPVSLPHAVPQQHSPKVVVLEKVKRGPMKTQATQTDVCLGRKPLPPNYLSLSPRTIRRVKMVAQGVQTNGIINGSIGRRLTKSFSEVGGERIARPGFVYPHHQTHEHRPCDYYESSSDHERLHRTQSEEPPRSPRSPVSTIPTESYKHSVEEEIFPLDESPHTSPTQSSLSRVESSERASKTPQDYFHQSFQFIHESDRDDTIDDSLPQNIEVLEQSMALNQKNLEYLQQKIAEQAKIDQGRGAERQTARQQQSKGPPQKGAATGQLSKTSTIQSEASISTDNSGTTTTTTTDSEKNEKEIFIDFEPRMDIESPVSIKKAKKRMLQKTLSEGEILLDIRKNELHKNTGDQDMAKDAPLIMSTSHENVKSANDRDLNNEYAYYEHTPIKDEGIFRDSIESSTSYSSAGGVANSSMDEDFHEKYICYKTEAFRKRSISLDEPGEEKADGCDSPGRTMTKSTPSSPQSDNDRELQKLKRSKKDKGSPENGDGIVPMSNITLGEKTSPFASSDSLANDLTRDHSDGMWNESQATVLQVDSGTDNGTVISSSDLSSLAASPGSLSVLTPSSRRKHLLMLQHQQRSSMDTDVLDEELDYSQVQSPTSPRIKIDAPKTVTSPVMQTQIRLQSPPITKHPLQGNGMLPNLPPKQTPTIAVTKFEPSLDLSDTAMKKTISATLKKRDRALSPSRRKDLQRRSIGMIDNNIICRSKESPDNGKSLASNSSDLKRTDSGKTNTTDISESTTTTDDYITANSDSSKKSGMQPTNVTDAKSHDGSSFESASSLYSLARVEALTEDMVVPCFSPPTRISTEALAEIANMEIMKSVEMIKSGKMLQSEKAKTKLPKSAPSPDNSKVSRKDAPSPTGSSSSSGSYSLTGTTSKTGDKIEAKESKTKSSSSAATTVEIATRPPIPSPMLEQTVPNVKVKGESISDDERSGHYSSSGYYESPVDDEDDDGGLTYKHSQKYRSRPWSTEEKRRKKKAFTLEFSKSIDDSQPTSTRDRFESKTPEFSGMLKTEKTPSKYDGKEGNVSFDDKVYRNTKIYKNQSYQDKMKSFHASPKTPKDSDVKFRDRELDSKRLHDRERVVKRTKSKTKSPVQVRTDTSLSSFLRTQGVLDYRRHEMTCGNGKLHINIPTSDDSSEQYRIEGGNGNGNLSPRKHRRPRESPRRKSGPSSVLSKSPTSFCPGGHRLKKKSISNESVSLPGSLPRRKSSMQPSTAIGSLEAEDIETTRVLTSAGNRLCPMKYMRSPSGSPKKQRMKTDKSASNAKYKALSAESLRSVSPGSDSVFYSEAGELIDVSGSSHQCVHCHHCGKEVDIISAEDAASPEQFTDEQPDIVQPPAGFADSPNSRASSGKHSSSRTYKKIDKRYRSEERSYGEKKHHHRYRQDTRAKSEERSKDDYQRTDSRPITRSAGTSLDRLGASGSTASIDPDEDDPDDIASDSGVYATSYWATVWLYIGDNEELNAWLKPEREDYKIPDSDGKLTRQESTESEHDFRKRYQAVTHRMVHRKACIEMYHRQSHNNFECDKSVIVRRQSGEFGFRIHGSKPVVVSAIEPDTPAETSGLEVGDIVIAVNGINVLDKSHSEVVKIAHAGSETLELEVARTCDIIASLACDSTAPAICAGYLWKRCETSQPQSHRWARRWFALKRDNCLYYYKSDASTQPSGALMLAGYSVEACDAGGNNGTSTPGDNGGRCGILVSRGGGASLTLVADTHDAASRWIIALRRASDRATQRDGWLDCTMRNMKLPPSSIQRPDCFGYLMKLGNKWKSWSKRYCVLKDACLYFYQDGNSKNSFGMACLHGYRVQHANTGGKKYAFEIMPCEPRQRHFYFHTESEMDKKRWVAALEFSIDRWMKAS